MSASLVGSEMCIRDRSPERAVEGTVHCFGGSGAGGAPSGVLHTAACRCCCLLYTSDAADDM
eukprot:11938676-Alexandrium_andersonii.AAC.1